VFSHKNGRSWHFSDGAEGMIYDNDRAGHEPLSWAGTSYCMLAVLQWLPVAHVIYFYKLVEKSNASQASKFLFMLSIW